MRAESKSVVLVAEDQPVNQRVANLLLKAMGVETALASNGKLAVESYCKERPALILMDVMMPVMDGLHASKEIRRIEFGTGIHTPIIACTGLDKAKITEEAISCWIDDYLGKPYSREMLASKLVLWLGVRLEAKPLTQVAHAFAAALAADDAPIDRQYLRILYGLEQLDDI